MPTLNDLQQRINNLSDKQSCFIVKAITEDVFSNMQNAPGFDVLATKADSLAKQVNIDLEIASSTDWFSTEMETNSAGVESRALLQSLARQPGMEDFVIAAIERYEDKSLDLGIISVGVAIAMVYVAVSAELDIDLGWFKLKKKGLSSEQQMEVAKETLPEVAKAMTGIDA